MIIIFVQGSHAFAMFCAGPRARINVTTITRFVKNLLLRHLHSVATVHYVLLSGHPPAECMVPLKKSL